MVKTSDQLKNMVLDYVKLTGVTYRETTTQIQQQYTDVEWQFLIGTALYITKLKSRDDRINFHYEIGISPQHKDGFQKIIEDEPEFINSLNELVILQDCSPRLVEEGNDIKGLEISSYVDVEELNRPNFYKKWEQVNLIANHIIRKIQIKINPKSKPTNTGTSTQSPYG